MLFNVSYFPQILFNDSNCLTFLFFDGHQYNLKDFPVPVALLLKSVFLVSAELGDFDPSVHIGNYVSEFRFIPDQVRTIAIYIHLLDLRYVLRQNSQNGNFL